VPICRQALTGWSQQPRTDSVSLSSLSLKHPVVLKLRDTTEDGLMSDDVVQKLNQNYELIILDEVTGTRHSLKYPGAKSVLDLKTDLFELSNIPARRQEWSGWPNALPNDSVLIGLAGLDHPTHNFTLRERTPPAQEPKKSKRVSFSKRPDM